MKVFDFIYRCILKRTEQGVEIIGFNSPYQGQDEESKKDILQAIEEKVIDELPLNEKIMVNFKVKFIENEDESVTPLFMRHNGI